MDGFTLALMNDTGMTAAELKSAAKEILGDKFRSIVGEKEPKPKKSPIQKPKKAPKNTPAKKGTSGLIPLKQITMHWHEGEQHHAKDAVFKTWKAFHEGLKPILEDGPGYNKVKFTAEWENGKQMIDRIDVGTGGGDYNPEKETPGEYLKKQKSAYYDANLNELDRKDLSWSDEAIDKTQKPAKPSKTAKSGDRKYKGKNIKDLTAEECLEMQKEVAARRQKQKTAEKKSKSRPVIEKVASNFATAAKQIIENIPAADIKEDPKGMITKMQKVETVFKNAISEVRSILGEDFDKETVNDEFKDVHALIVELKKKYA